MEKFAALHKLVSPYTFIIISHEPYLVIEAAEGGLVPFIQVREVGGQVPDPNDSRVELKNRCLNLPNMTIFYIFGKYHDFWVKSKFV